MKQAIVNVENIEELIESLTDIEYRVIGKLEELNLKRIETIAEKINYQKNIESIEKEVGNIVLNGINEIKINATEEVKKAKKSISDELIPIKKASKFMTRTYYTQMLSLVAIAFSVFFFIAGMLFGYSQNDRVEVVTKTPSFIIRKNSNEYFVPYSLAEIKQTNGGLIIHGKGFSQEVLNMLFYPIYKYGVLVSGIIVLIFLVSGYLVYKIIQLKKGC